MFQRSRDNVAKPIHMTLASLIIQPIAFKATVKQYISLMRVEFHSLQRIPEEHKHHNDDR